MNFEDNANWWCFSIEPENRTHKILNGDSGLREVNAPGEGGRHGLGYSEYLELDKLLSCQVPSSRVPDERCFVITHQIFELMFKLMIFDLSVVSNTLRRMLTLKNDQLFLSTCTSTADDQIWAPALTASSRIKYASRIMAPAVLGYLSPKNPEEETFSSQEFSGFREYLPPASGFQTAQFRLIQVAFGKKPLLEVKLFDATEYSRNYHGHDSTPGPTSVVDPLILRRDSGVVQPAESSPLAACADLDSAAHEVLARLAVVAAAHIEKASCEVRRIDESQIAAAVASFHNMALGRLGKKDARNEEQANRATTTFRESLQTAVETENRRRETLVLARLGALYLHHMAPESFLGTILGRLVSADIALHGDQEGSFLSGHQQLARSRIHDLEKLSRQSGGSAPSIGTGGGGVAYLGMMQKRLLPLFPALIGFRDLDDVPGFSWLS